MSCEHRNLGPVSHRCAECGISAEAVVFSLHDRIAVRERELAEAQKLTDIWRKNYDEAQVAFARSEARCVRLVKFVALTASDPLCEWYDSARAALATEGED